MINVEMEKSKEKLEEFSWTREFNSPTDINPELLGNKGANLAEMTRLGLPVPPGFTLTTDAWRAFKKEGRLPSPVWDEILIQLQHLEEKTGKKFADPNNPLIVSVRSGSRYSMPGMMETVLNIGLTSKTEPGLIKQFGEFCAEDSYKRLREAFDKITGEDEPPQDSHQQLKLATEAVFASWDNARAQLYRQYNGIPENAGTAATVQKVVFGNADENSGVGVFFPRSPQDGARKPTGEFVRKGQGEVVDGRGRPTAIPEELTDQLTTFGEQLERRFRQPQDIEFTVEKGKLWLLQSRTLRGTPLARVRIASEMLKEGLIIPEEAYQRVTSADINFLFHPGFDPQAQEKARKTSLLAKGRTASPGVALGFLTTTPQKAKEMSTEGKSPVLVTDYFDASEIEILFFAKAIATRIGGTASHMALVMQAAGVPGVVNCEGITIKPGKGILCNGKMIKDGERVSVDATSGEIFKGWLPQDTSPQLPQELKMFLKERNKYFGESAWASALYPVEMPFRRDDFLRRIEAEAIPEIGKWNSPKAIETIVLNSLFPPEEIIQARIFTPDDFEGIEEAILNVYERRGCEAIPRSIHTRENLGKEPWANVPKGRVKEFLYDRNYVGNPAHPEYRGFPQWKENPSLVAIIVPTEPVGKMDKELYPKHFAFTVGCLDTQPPKVVVDLSLGNPHLREIEKIPPEKLIQIIAFINRETPYCLGQISFEFGIDHFNKRNLEKLVQTSRGEITKTAIIEQIFVMVKERYNSEDLRAIDIKRMVALVSGLAKSGLLTNEMYEFFIKRRSWLITELVANKVFVDWWRPPFALPHLMSALDDTLGFSVIEGQGRMERNYFIPWKPKVYGLKGPQEVTAVRGKVREKSA